MSTLMQLRQELRQTNDELARFIAKNQHSMAKAAVESDDDDEQDEAGEVEEPEARSQAGEDLQSKYFNTIDDLDRFIKTEEAKRQIAKDPVVAGRALMMKLLELQKRGAINARHIVTVNSIINSVLGQRSGADLQKSFVNKQGDLFRRLGNGSLCISDFRRQSLLLANFGPTLGDPSTWFSQG